jgi:hypothetical protein
MPRCRCRIGRSERRRIPAQPGVAGTTWSAPLIAGTIHPQRGSHSAPLTVSTAHSPLRAGPRPSARPATHADPGRRASRAMRLAVAKGGTRMVSRVGGRTRRLIITGVVAAGVGAGVTGVALASTGGSGTAATTSNASTTSSSSSPNASSSPSSSSSTGTSHAGTMPGSTGTHKCTHMSGSSSGSASGGSSAAPGSSNSTGS